MQLTLWTYEGPPHVGAMRIATAMQGVHYVLHAPQGDTYADLLFTMIERRDRAPAGHLHDVPGARSRRRHRGAVQDGRARGLRALPAASHDGRRILHRRTDPGRSRRPRQRAGPAGPGHCRSNCRPISARKTGARRETFYQLVRAFSPDHAARTRRRRERRAAICSARRRSAFAIATTCARSPACCGALGVEVQRDCAAGAHARRSRADSARPISTSCFIPRSRCRRPNGWKRTIGSRS